MIVERPDWWQKRAAQRRVVLDHAVEIVRASLSSFSGVRGALIFGSYARGESGPESDLDIVLVRETELPQLKRDDDVRAAWRLDVPYDLVTLTPRQFDELPLRNPFYAQAVREGIWLDAT